MYVAINDVSLQEKYTASFSKKQGIKIFHDFLDSMFKLTQQGLLDNLFIPENFCSEYCLYKLARDYSLQDWINDKGIHYKYKSFFFQLLDKYSTPFDVKSLCVDSRLVLSDCIGPDLRALSEKEMYDIWNCERSISYGASILIDFFYEELSTSCLYSFGYNQDQFSRESLPTISLIINDSDEWYQYNELINLFGNCTDYNKLKDISKDNLLSNICSGTDLWENRIKLFPNLIFCENVKDQLEKDSELFHLKAVLKRLNVLQDYFSKNHSSFSIKELSYNARDESDSVKNDPKLRKLRLFKIPNNGGSEFFFYHMDLGGKYGRKGRLHFYPDLKNKVCYIGYIGSHLSTDKYKC